MSGMYIKIILWVCGMVNKCNGPSMASQGCNTSILEGEGRQSQVQAQFKQPDDSARPCLKIKTVKRDEESQGSIPSKTSPPKTGEGTSLVTS